MTSTPEQVAKAVREFRKKPVVVKAIRWNGAGSGLSVVLAFILDGHDSFDHLPRAPDDAHVHPGIGYSPPDGNLYIPTLKGTMTAHPGDWIIRSIKGEFYPCKPDIFEQTYEPADLTPFYAVPQDETAGLHTSAPTITGEVRTPAGTAPSPALPEEPEPEATRGTPARVLQYIAALRSAAEALRVELEKEQEARKRAEARADELSNKELDMLMHEIGHQVGAKDGQKIIEAVFAFVAAKEQAESKLARAMEALTDADDTITRLGGATWQQRHAALLDGERSGT